MPFLTATWMVAACTIAAEAQDQWTWLDPQPQSFELTSAAFRDSLHGFACGSGGALYATDDGGESWARIQTSYYRELNDLVFLDSRVGLAVGFDGAILRTTDGGASWRPVAGGTTMTLRDVEGKGTLAFAAGDAGLLKSVDAGLHWQPVGLAGTLSFSGIRLKGADTLFALNRTIGASSDTAYFGRSVDGGVTWTRTATVPPGAEPARIMANRLLFSSGDTVYAQGSLTHYVSRQAIYEPILLRTEDGGAHWTSRAIRGGNRGALLHFRDSRKGIAVFEDSTYATGDAGATWTPTGIAPVTMGNGIPLVTSVPGSGSNSYMALGWNYVQKSSDGAKTWRTVLRGSQGRSYKDIHFPEADIGYALTDDDGKPGLVATRNGGRDWAPIPTSVGGPAFNNIILSSLHFSDTRSGVAAGKANDGDKLGLIYHTADAGANWTLAQQVPGHDINDMRFASGIAGIAVGDSGLVLRTIDGGAHWAVGASGTDHSLVSVDYPDPALGYAVGVKWITHPISHNVHETVILRTEDGGATWKRRSTIAEMEGRAIRFLDANTGFMILDRDIGISSVIMKTRDGGSTWKQVAVFPYFIGARISVLDSLNLFAMGITEVLRSRDGGESWSPEAIPARYALALDFPSRNAGFLACEGAILKVVPGSATAIRTARGRMAPFVVGNDLRYRLDAPARVTALLFDFRGRRVSSLFDGLAGAGSHQLPRPVGLAHGTYLLDFRIGSERQRIPFRH